MKNEKFTSFDGTVIQCYLWDDVRNPRAVVQIWRSTQGVMTILPGFSIKTA